jgi:2-C-methyl-D-erythritol 2,4-cyclodiphosphate synthase
MYLSSIGQDSHRFEPESSNKPLILGGIVIPGCIGLAGNSDADVVLHAITNAVSGLHGIPVLGTIADDLCLQHGIKDSSVYLEKTLELLTGYEILHLSLSIEARRPVLSPYFTALRDSIARLLTLDIAHVTLTATSGEGLTAFGRGEGIQVFAIMSAQSR